MTKTLIAALVAATALLAPAVSQAATVSLENGTIVYRGEGAEGIDLLVSTYQPYGDENTYVSLNDSAAQTIKPGTPCFMSDGYDPTPLCPLDPSQPLVVHGSAARDLIGVNSNISDAKPIAIHGGDGNDLIEDKFDGGAGRVLTGGPGNDEIEGFGGNDSIDGGDGNDVVNGGVGRRPGPRRRGRRRDVGRPVQGARRRPARRRPGHRHDRGVGHPVRPHEPAARDSDTRRRGQRRPARRGRQRRRHRAHPRRPWSATTSAATAPRRSR